MIIEIDDISRPELNAYARLTDAQLRSREDMFICEGTMTISHALDAGIEPVSLLMERKHIEGKARNIIARAGDIPVYTAESEVLAALTGFQLTRGVLCAMKRPKKRAMEEVCANAGRIAILENIVDSSNAGAIFRSAAALGMDALLLSPSCCDILSRKSVRVSMGTVFQMPWARIERGWHGEAFDVLKNMGFKTVALALTEDSVTIDDAALKNEEKLALLLGAEGDGLARETIDACDYTALIPMAHGVNSLNVAAAAAVAFWVLGGKGK